MSDIQKTIIVPAEELDFDNAPTFCSNENPSATGKGLRSYSLGTVTSPGQPDVVVRPGGVLLKIFDDSLLFFDGNDFAEHFSRVLKNGEIVKLSKPLSVQLSEIRHAEDGTHLKDVSNMTGMKVLENVVGFVDGMKTKALQSETVAEFRKTGKELRTGFGELITNVTDEAKATLQSPTVKGVRERLKRLAWGKFGKGKESNNN